MISFLQVTFEVCKGAVDVVLVYGDLGLQIHIEMVRKQPHTLPCGPNIRPSFFEAAVRHGERSFLGFGSVEVKNMIHWVNEVKDLIKSQLYLAARDNFESCWAPSRSASGRKKGCNLTRGTLGSFMLTFFYIKIA